MTMLSEKNWLILKLNQLPSVVVVVAVVLVLVAAVHLYGLILIGWHDGKMDQKEIQKKEISLEQYYAKRRLMSRSENK